MLAFASLLPQDGAPPAAAPQTPPPAPTQPAPVVKPDAAAPKTTAAAPKGAAVTAKAANKDAKPLIVPTPKVKEPEIPSYRVAVRMPGNRRFTGVVMRDKLFSDLVRLNAHNTQEVYRRSEAFTLCFVDGVDGNVTLRWNQVLKLEIREILDATGLRTIEEEYHRLMIVKREQLAAEQAQRELDEMKERAAQDAAKAGEDAKKEKVKEDELPPLLAEFRPDEGWSATRKEQIEWRRTVVGTGPDKSEQRFLEVFPQWLEAYTAWQAAHPPKAPDAKGDPAKDDAKKDEPAKDDAKKDAPKPDDAKKDETKKEEGKKDDAPKDPAPAPKDGGGAPR